MISRGFDATSMTSGGPDKVREFSKNRRFYLTTTNNPVKKNKQEKNPKTLGYDGMFTSAYTTVRDEWFKVDKPKKLKENIDRIKGLLK